LLIVPGRSRCTCVSKAWKALWENSPHFWTQLYFDKGMRPRPAHLRRVVHKYAQRQSTHIVIKDCGKAWIDAQGISVITDDLPRLRHVELGCSRRDDCCWGLIPVGHDAASPYTDLKTRTLNHCETLVLNRLVYGSRVLLHHLVGGARHTLKNLEVLDMPLGFHYFHNQMVNLTCLKLVGSADPQVLRLLSVVRTLRSRYSS